MSFRTQLPSLTPLTFGTGKVSDKTNPEHMAVTRAAMEAGLWFHTSHVYGDGGVFETLHAAFAEDRAHIPRCIFKVDGKSPELLRETVEASLRGTGVEQVDIAQICGNPAVETLYPGASLHQTMVELKDAGKVGSYSLEIFWPFSTNLLPAVQDELFDSVIFYYNVVEREVSNPLFERLQQKQTPILALRTLGGGPQRFGALDDVAQSVLRELYERSGCDTELEFRFRFPLSVPQVKTTIGATSRLDHLQMLLQANANFAPLEDDIIEDIQGLHRTWFAEKGI